MRNQLRRICRGPRTSAVRLTNTTLVRADLWQADPRGAVLTGADLNGADLTGARLASLDCDLPAEGSA